MTPIDETLGALQELITAGKVRAIGASNFDADQLREADAVARENSLTPFTAVQNEYSLLVRDAEDECSRSVSELGIGFVPYFPLASGLLTGKYRRGQPGPSGARLSGRDEIGTDEQFALVEALQRYADERGVPLIEVAIGALLDPRGRRERDRRGDEARAGQGQRRRRAVDPGRRGSGGPERRPDLGAGLTPERSG